MFEDNTQPGQIQGQRADQVSAQGTPQPTVMPSQAAEPRDMFADVEPSAESSGVGAGYSSSVAAEGFDTTVPAQQKGGEGYTFDEDEEIKPWYMQKKFIILILGVILALIVIIFGVQFALKFFAKTQPLAPSTPPVTTTPLEPTTPENQQQAPAQEPTPTISEPQGTETQQIAPTQPSGTQQQSQGTMEKTEPQTDTDGDGLADAEEKTIGANISLPDTDGDGLSDREEFRVFGTDPLKADTDSDGYADGEEVKNGYNPKGEGKLFTVPTN